MRQALRVGYPSQVPSLFRRRSTQLVEDAVREAASEETSTPTRPRAYTAGKGKATPKRPSAGRRLTAAPAPANKREARELRRAARLRDAEETRREGTIRDRSPERLLVRNVVDSRRTVGTWFFGGALIILLGSSPQMPLIVQWASTALWVTLAIGLVIDSVLISRKIKKLIRERYPKTQERLGSLYFYAIMRSITFRRMRMPVPRVNIGDEI